MEREPSAYTGLLPIVSGIAILVLAIIGTRRAKKREGEFGTSAAHDGDDGGGDGGDGGGD